MIETSELSVSVENLHGHESNGDKVDNSDADFGIVERNTLKRSLHQPAQSDQHRKRSKAENDSNEVLSILENDADGRTLLKFPKDRQLPDPQLLANIIIRASVKDVTTFVFNS